MRIKKGDSVVVIAGKDRGKSGKVLEAMPATEKVLIEGLNMAKRHQRARSARQKGQMVERAMPIHVSNVMLLDPKDGKRTRVGMKLENGKKSRVARRSGAVLS